LKSLHAPRNQALRQRLRAAREEHGVTQQELAKQLGVPQSFVSKYETGERRLDVIEFSDVCAALEVDAAEFLQKLLTDTSNYKMDGKTSTAAKD
jgi:transcriptional regulator with XRE-family HTH domain